MRSARRAGLALLISLLLGLCLSGCEEGSSLTGGEFFIDPPAVTLASTDEALTLTAVGGEEPFVWSVADETFGTVTTNGRSVVYARTAASGVNIVTLVDAKTWTASCTITQLGPDDETVNVTAAPMENPMAWNRR